jgi:hypothetical protein
MPISTDELGARASYSFGAGSTAEGAPGRRRARARSSSRRAARLCTAASLAGQRRHRSRPSACSGRRAILRHRRRQRGALDVDVTTGFGPEIYANPAPPRGAYFVYVNYYGSGPDGRDVTTAQVAIVTQEGTVSEKREIVQVPMRKPGELTLVKSFTYP